MSELSLHSTMSNFMLYQLASKSGARQRYHLEVGANIPMKRVLARRYGFGKGTVGFLFDPQYSVMPEYRNACERKSQEMGNCTCLPYAAWVRNETLSFRRHNESQGQYSTVYSGTVAEYADLRMGHMKRRRNEMTYQVHAIDLADWMERNIPRDPKPFLSAKFDVEGAEYVLMRDLMLRGQACRFDYIDFEAHAMSNAKFAPFRTFDVLLPWLLAGCEKPPKVEVAKFYGSANKDHDARVDAYVKRTQPSREAWCADCVLLDKPVDTKLGWIDL